MTDLLLQKSGSIYKEPIFSIRPTDLGNFFQFSWPATFSENLDVTVRQKVCTVKVQICVPSCRSESSNI